MSNATVRIYHNPRCTKSRQTLKLLRERGVEPEVVEYFKTPPSADELDRLLTLLGKEPQEIVRKGESVYKEQFKGRELSREDWLAAIAENPILLERPIVVRGERAVLGRPPENVEELL